MDGQKANEKRTLFLVLGVIMIIGCAIGVCLFIRGIWLEMLFIQADEEVLEVIVQRDLIEGLVLMTFVFPGIVSIMLSRKISESIITMNTIAVVFMVITWFGLLILLGFHTVGTALSKFASYPGTFDDAVETSKAFLSGYIPFFLAVTAVDIIYIGGFVSFRKKMKQQSMGMPQPVGQPQAAWQQQYSGWQQPVGQPQAAWQQQYAGWQQPVGQPQAAWQQPSVPPQTAWQPQPTVPPQPTWQQQSAGWEQATGQPQSAVPPQSAGQQQAAGQTQPNVPPQSTGR